MSLAIIFAATVLVTTGAAYRWWLKRGTEFWATWWRAASYNLMVGGAALLTFLPDRDWFGLLVLELSIFIFCGALFVAQKRAKKRKEIAAKESFEKLSKEEIEKLNKTQRKTYKAERKQFRKKVRKATNWTKAQLIIVWSAGAAAGVIYLHRLWFKLAIDGTYNPTVWWPLVFVLGVVGWAVLLRAIPLKTNRFKHWLFTYPIFVVPALIALFIAVRMAGGHFVTVADEVQWVPGEGGADSDVVATTAIDNCPQEFRLDDDGDGEIDPIPDDPDYPDSQRVADDPGYLIREAEEAGIWEEGRYSIEMITTGPNETNSNVNWCVSNFDAWIAMAKLYPERWEGSVTDHLNALVETDLLSPEGRDALISQLN